MKKIVSNVVTAVLVVGALLVTVAVARREFTASSATPASEPRPAEPRPVDDWQALATEGVRIGSRDAPLVLIEFADFQCPFCAVAANNLREALSHYGDDVAVVFRHFPLEHIHPHAYAAAVAAECAASQDRFEAFHDLLFARQDEIGETPWAQFAAAAAVDTVPFARCMEATWPRDRVFEDARAARKIGLTGTPSIVVGGLLLSGTPSVATLREHIGRALAEITKDSAGRALVVDRAAGSDRLRPWASGPWLEIEAERTKSTPGGFLDYLGIVAVGPSGRIYAVERGSRQVLVFDSNLEYEHALPSSMGRNPVSAREVDGDSIVFFDYDSKTTLVWSGYHADPGRRSSVPGLEGYDPYDVWRLGNTADFVVAYRRRSYSQDDLDEQRSDVVGLARRGALRVDSILSFPSREVLVVTPEDGGFSVGPHPFGRRPYLRLVAGDKIVYALSDEFKVTILNLAAGTESRWSYEAEVTQVEDDEVERAAASMRSASRADALLENAPYFRSVLAGLAVDDDRELIWVGLRAQADSLEWAAFDLSGRHRASLLLPDKVEVVGAWRDRLIGIEYDRKPFGPVLKSYYLRESGTM